MRKKNKKKEMMSEGSETTAFTATILKDFMYSANGTLISFKAYATLRDRKLINELLQQGLPIELD